MTNCLYSKVLLALILFDVSKGRYHLSKFEDAEAAQSSVQMKTKNKGKYFDESI